MSSKEIGGIILNPYCGSACSFCGRFPRVSKIELKRQEINVARNLIDFRKRGIQGIEISGADPIEYEKIVPLIKDIKSTGFSFVQLSTHGKRLADKEFASQMIASGLDKLRIPLYGASAKIHEAITNAPGSFEATVKGIKNVLENSSISIQVSSLIMQQNKEHLISLVDFVRELGIKDYYISVPCVANKDYSYLVPFKKLSPYVQRVFEHAQEVQFPVHFLDIPYCIFGVHPHPFIFNRTSPPDMGQYCQPPKQFKTGIKDIPSYRIKKKVEICNSCVASPLCDGFYANDIERFGVGNLQSPAHHSQA